MKKRPNGTTKRLFDELAKVESDECVIWADINTRGYGRFFYGGKWHFAHRAALTQHIGEPPHDKPLALHKPDVCHNPSCMNYRHLYWGSHDDNMKDKLLDGTTSRGRQHHKNKLTEQQVLAIRADSRSLTDIANEYGIHRKSVYQIQKRTNWGWL